MNNCAVVCEYNPFHSGHEYQLSEVRRRGANNVFCVMSGAFVQSTEPAFCDKSIRAECAVLGGADAVIELPTVFSTASAGFFAEGAIKIISKIKDITHVAMGAVATPTEVSRMAEIKISQSDKFALRLKDHMARGVNYNTASAAALIDLYQNRYLGSTDIQDFFKDPNNILCVEYITAINKYAPHIQPLIIPRLGATYNEEKLCGDHISATAIRTAEANGKLDNVKRYLPHEFDKIAKWRREHSPDISAYEKMLVYAVKSKTTEEIAKLRDCAEGLEYLIKDTNAYDIDGLLTASVGKRYSKKRIKRLLFDCLLNIEKTLLEHRFVTRLLACSSAFDFSLLPDCVKTNNADIKAAAASDNEIAANIKIDENAAALYNTLCNATGGYYNYSLVKV